MVTSNFLQRIQATVSPSEWADTTLDEIFRGHSAVIAKRLLDLGVATLGMVALLPLLLAIAIAVKVDTPGPVLFVSRRLGRNGRVFRCLKFRTMTQDGRETRLGSLLRRYGLDELPQLVNVIRGEMSVVGPRPLLASDGPRGAVGRLRRLELMPGMTGLWAVHEAERMPSTSYISPDDTYRRNWSIWLDVVIVMRSTGAALAGRGR
jgi:lipopolysaccharide/colanic/teichoic acid biosynthesis glycosyltransferase